MVVAIMLVGAPAQASTLSSGGGTIVYVAKQGERNDVKIGVDSLLGSPIYTFTDNDAVPIEIGGGLCEMVNGVGACPYSGVVAITVDVRDRDDTVQVSDAGKGGVSPISLPTLLIGGRGIDVLMGGLGPDKLKGNNGRDSLRGRMGADAYKGGRGSDTLQTLDGEADALIACGEGARDLVRADPIDPEPRSCELGGRKVSKPF
jgi:Ca2+-binding RTX toxin-like protein